MKDRQTGAVLVMVAILIVVLIGVAALALDVGRLLVLRTEMQNAADAAALAAAAELNGSDQAQARSRKAVITLLQHDSKFGQLRELLDDTSGVPLNVCVSGDALAGCDVLFEYYCAIENDSDAYNLSSECKGAAIGGEEGAQKVVALGDNDAHYVRVTLNPDVQQGNDEQKRYSIDLYFLPVLNAIGLNVPDQASTKASALAGRSFVICNYPPIMICNPYEGQSENGMPKQLKVGQQVKLYMGSSSPGAWAPGDFGLLEPPSGEGGAIDVSEYLAGEGLECTDAYLTTKTGVQVNMIKWGLNTRFGIYEFKYNISDYKPAPNVLDYPRDQNLANDPSARIGTGVWQATPGEYWSTYLHDSADPGGLSSRYDYYKWEIDNSDYPRKSVAPPIECNPIDNNGCPTGSNIWKGRPQPDNAVGDINRRVITVPVLNCTALGIAGKEKNIWAAQEEYWKRFFITEHVNDPNEGAEIFAEYIGNAGVRDGTFHVEVKLYE